MSDSWVNVGMDARDCLKDLKGISRDQFPFAYAAALTETARYCQAAVQARTRDVFKLHTEYIPRGILVQAAKKKDVVQLKMAFAAVFTSDKITPFMSMHETGGTKRPSGRALSIPGKSLGAYNVKTSTGAMKTKWRPKTLLHEYTGKASSKSFILPARGNKPARIARRKRKGQYPIEVLYIFRPSAEIEPTWGFEDTVVRVAPKVFPKLFDNAWSVAMSTVKE